MELKIQVDETMFKDVLEKELKAFSKQELHGIIRECICEVLKSDDMVKKLFVKKTVSGYYGPAHDEPSELMYEAARKIDLSPAFEEIQSNMIEELKENHKELIETAVYKLILSGLCYTSNMQNAMQDAVHEVLARKKNED